MTQINKPFINLQIIQATALGPNADRTTRIISPEVTEPVELSDITSDFYWANITAGHPSYGDYATPVEVMYAPTEWTPVASGTDAGIGLIAKGTWPEGFTPPGLTVTLDSGNDTGGSLPQVFFTIYDSNGDFLHFSAYQFVAWNEERIQSLTIGDYFGFDIDQLRLSVNHLTTNGPIIKNISVIPA